MYDLNTRTGTDEKQQFTYFETFPLPHNPDHIIIWVQRGVIRLGIRTVTYEELISANVPARKWRFENKKQKH